MATVLPVYVKQTLNYQALLFISWFIPLPKKCENLGCHVTFIFAYKQSTHTHTHNHKRRHRKQVLKSDSGPSQCGDEGKKKVEKAQIAGKKKGGKTNECLWKHINQLFLPAGSPVALEAVRADSEAPPPCRGGLEKGAKGHPLLLRR